MRLKDADELKKAYESVYNKIWLEVNGIMSIIDDALTIDAVPVVRCKDCKHFSGAKDSNGYVTAVGYCNHINHHIMPCMFDFFCGDGERKETQ